MFGWFHLDTNEQDAHIGLFREKTMSTDLELEEFNGLGTTLAPRIPNAENRNLEAKVILLIYF